MEINMDEIKFKMNSRKRLEGEITMTDQRFLTTDERIMLDQKYTRILRKYNVAGTDFIDEIKTPKPLSMEEARLTAKEQHDHLTQTRIAEINEKADNRLQRLNERMAQVHTRHTDEITRINQEAGNRGILNSTITTNQLQNAVSMRNAKLESLNSQIVHSKNRRDLAIARITQQHDARMEALAKRLYNDSIRLNVAASREKSIQKSRSFNDMLKLQRDRLVAPMNIQEMINEELYALYLNFLFTLHPRRAQDLVQWDPLFAFNLSLPFWARLRDAMQYRGNMARPDEGGT